MTVFEGYIAIGIVMYMWLWYTIIRDKEEVAVGNLVDHIIVFIIAVFLYPLVGEEVAVDNLVDHIIVFIIAAFLYPLVGLVAIIVSTAARDRRRNRNV